MLRPYQQKAIDDLYDWFSNNPTGNPCMVLPTGSGKSHIVAALCKNAVQQWPQTKVLMLTHQQELIAQNAEKMRLHWPNAPLGIYSAGLRKRDIDQITFGAIQSIAKKAHLVGHVDLILVDECHLINNKESGNYRSFIAELIEINPNLRVIGLSATPFRLGQGLITEGDYTLFNDLIEPVTVKELVDAGYLSRLKSKHPAVTIDTSHVHKRGGEFIAKELESASDEITEAAVQEVIARAEGRKHWLLFCAGVAHAEHCAEELSRYGIKAECLHGGHSSAERAGILERFTTGQTQALTNANILTTGFDYPDIDLIALLRPTMSAALYVQMVGRGMRLKSHTDHCLVLDFAKNVETHGPITNVRPPKAGGKGTGEIPVKICPQCFEQVHLSVMNCPDCGYIWEQHKKPLVLSNADIMGQEPEGMEITDWRWSAHTSNRTGKSMLKVRYYGGLSDPAITEYLAITSEGYAGQKAMQTLARIANESEPDPDKRPVDLSQMSDVARWLNSGDKPAYIEYEKNGKFYNVIARRW